MRADRFPLSFVAPRSRGDRSLHRQLRLSGLYRVLRELAAHAIETTIVGRRDKEATSYSVRGDHDTSSTCRRTSRK